MPKADNSTLFLCGPEADEIVKKFGDEAELFTFWSLETAYPVDRLRYHLGQLGMLNLMNRLADGAAESTR